MTVSKHEATSTRSSEDCQPSKFHFSVPNQRLPQQMCRLSICINQKQPGLGSQEHFRAIKGQTEKSHASNSGAAFQRRFKGNHGISMKAFL